MAKKRLSCLFLTSSTVLVIILKMNQIPKYYIFSYLFTGILTNIKKESEEQKVESSEGGSSSASCDAGSTMSFPSGHDSDGLHYRVQGTFTR